MNSPDHAEVALTRRRTASGKMPFLLFCDKEILYHGFLCFSAICVTVTQATMLNFFIIAFFRGYYHQVSDHILSWYTVTEKCFQKFLLCKPSKCLA